MGCSVIVKNKLTNKNKNRYLRVPNYENWKALTRKQSVSLRYIEVHMSYIVGHG
jgi:hypothetical protein